ncbi:hypothetical protein B0H17DRAFT_1200107 [Mycena rosella]|uniref:Uncharacterized protein n=1 Tax=Mycena rosella TaxID=1033263 RepID=A0AAD7GKB0_MYCRO|nr:hypothetical protein B0H17DRAFT_1200107 [Mycena rosella]
MASFLPTIRNSNKCPLCGTTLIPKLATGGQAPRTLHIRCASAPHSDQPYFFRFGADASPPMLSTPQMTDSMSTTSTAPCCADAMCGSKRIDKGCCRAMCRRHCNTAGPCTLVPHEQNRRKKSSSQAAQTRPPPPVLTLPSFDPWIGFSTSLDEFQTNAMRPQRALEQYEARERSRFDEEERNLDQRLELALGVRSPSLGLSLEEELNLMDAQLEKEEIDTLLQQQADARRAQEIQDFELALRLSREDSQQSSADAAALTPSQPVASTSALRALSPSPDLPQSLLPPPQPRTRLPAPSLQASKKRPVPFKITTQLNKTWMALHCDKQQPSPAESSTALQQPSSSRTPASTSSSVFHIKSGGSRRVFANPQLTERFTLIFLLPNEGPKVLCIDRVPTWPSY